MSERDPFDPFANADDAEGTVIRPNPAGRRAAPAARPAAATPSFATDAALDLGKLTGINPLVAAANQLLSLVPQLRNTMSYGDLGALRDKLVHAVKEFELNARNRSARNESILAARYCLCTLLDETVASTPWGGGGAWSERNLLVSFHNEAWGGEKFFQLLDKVTEDAAGNIDLLELMYVCLAFGFQGKYRVSDNGRARLDEIKDKLHQLIRAKRGEYERELSPFWKGVTDKRNPLVRVIPLWVVGSIAALLLLTIYLIFSYRLNWLSDPVQKQLHAIPGTVFAPKPVLRPAEKPRLSKFLAPEIAQRLVSVSENADQSLVTIHGADLFASGSATLNEKYAGLIRRIADGLKTVNGKVLVVGHTDDRRIISARFPSNWHLSQARALEVARMLIAHGNARERFSAEGKGDLEPIATNDTPENRARNRRVEITVSGPTE